MRLQVADGAAERVRREEAAEARGVVAGEGIVEACFGVAFVAGEFVVRRAGGSLQPLSVGNFLTVWREVGIITKLARRLAGAAAGGDGARGTELVGKVVEDAAAAVSGGDAAAPE